jgi:hypothetical protein
MIDSSGYNLGMRVGNEMQAHVSPQLFLDGNRLRAAVANRTALTALIAHIDRRIEKGIFKDTYVEIDTSHTVPRFLMHRSNDSCVSAASPEQAKKMLALIEAKWAEIRNALQTTDEEKMKVQQPSILLKLTLRPNDEFRGVAKIAFETVALICGPEFVLDSSFDPIRDYIKGDVRLPPTDPADPKVLSVDQRFVQRMDECPLKFTDQHGVLLAATPVGVFGLVVLYGAHSYKVRLAPPRKGQNWVRFYEFSYKKDGHGEISEFEFARRALERFPEAVGIKAEDVPRYLKLIGAA